MEGTPVDADALIADYLGRLRAASWPLPPARREELQGEVTEHIGAALAEAGARDEVTVRNVLERLGTPEDIAAAEAADGVSPGAPAPQPWAAPPEAARSWGAVEIIAILLLTLGSVLLPFIGPIAGLLFTWMSRVWTTGVKVIATVIVVVLLGLPIVALLSVRAIN
jgi:hypothetical protein